MITVPVDVLQTAKEGIMDWALIGAIVCGGLVAVPLYQIGSFIMRLFGSLTMGSSLSRYSRFRWRR